MYTRRAVKTIKLRDRWTDHNETWHVYSMGLGTQLLRSRILNFAPASRGATPNLARSGGEMTHPQRGAYYWIEIVNGVNLKSGVRV